MGALHFVIQNIVMNKIFNGSKQSMGPLYAYVCGSMFVYLCPIGLSRFVTSNKDCVTCVG